ncbi:response regulator transcription factor [Leptolyngbya sp. FACHB-671]|uniref:response regulator transcription factor n=1 Tax=unclassified Leptolyngbya TaxID=2650499 RepID=UPI001686AD33|nr:MULTISPECIES: response regulator transcription factor [unclassified Leptolyngbya]MBD1868070.1 response regulator transcription factor [Cyanobacteria bacterium FACHB-471]MBD2001441.1 response regulator transcription factor [Leptolyngbya sp. FACHB-541]MBD2069691.1 response regulator transcription factor [Leptolyngbya sp. FACHB-671]
MIRVLVVDDQSFFREGLVALLSLEADIEVVGQAMDGRVAIDLTGKLQPDVILMDIRMPNCDGVTATHEILRSYPWIRILVLTTFDEDDYVWKLLQAGATGYLLKNTPSGQVADAIRTIHRGHSQLGPTIAAKVLAQLQPPVSATPVNLTLSDRELDVLKLLGQGKTNREIAKTLHITEGTVRNYISRILSELNVSDRTQAALWASENLDPRSP